MAVDKALASFDLKLRMEFELGEEYFIDFDLILEG